MVPRRLDCDDTKQHHRRTDQDNAFRTGSTCWQHAAPTVSMHTRYRAIVEAGMRVLSRIRAPSTSRGTLARSRGAVAWSSPIAPRGAVQDWPLADREGGLVADRRPMGALEHEVLIQLWGMPNGGTPGEVLDALGGSLAYTTVMTILTRLWQKGLVDRVRSGRAYVYTPNVSEAELAAHRMRESMVGASNRRQVLTHFVDTLSAREARTLRALLEGTKRR